MVHSGRYDAVVWHVYSPVYSPCGAWAADVVHVVDNGDGSWRWCMVHGDGIGCMLGEKGQVVSAV